jgi:hypothetical protein
MSACEGRRCHGRNFVYIRAGDMVAVMVSMELRARLVVRRRRIASRGVEVVGDDA